MDDPLYREPRLVVSDGDRLQVLGPSPGPAGVSTVELADGATWQVDHVNLDTFALLEVDSADARGSTLLTTAFGGDGALFAIDSAVDLAGDDWSAISERRPPWRRSRWRGQPFGPDRAGQAGGLALLTDQATDPRIHPLGRIVAALEAASQVHRNPAQPLIGPLTSGLLQRCGELVDTFDDSEIEPLDLATLHAINALIGDVEGTQWSPRTTSQRFAGLADRITRVAESAQPAETFGEFAALKVRPARQELLVDPMASAAALPERGGEAPILERTADALVAVTVTRSDEQRWARVMRRGSFMLLGQAPLRRRGLIDVAEVVIPADVADDDLHAEVLNEADLGALVLGPLDVIRAAITAGREAARADRLARTEEAQLRWEHCSELWRAAGDPDRAAQARELAHDAHWTHAPNPTLTDQVVEPLAALT